MQRALFLLLALWLPQAAAVTPQETEFFEKSIRPVLVEQCFKCHGPEKAKAELRLDSRAAVLKGSDVGPIVVPGKPEESSLIKSVRHEGDSKMPEKADKLGDEQIAALTEWVRLGVPWPETERAQLSTREQAAQRHWAFQRVKKGELPAVKNVAWPQAPLDHFILHKLEEKQLTPSPPAERRTLIRRASFDLLGLPPTFAEVEAFEKDTAPDAFARVVDRLLASPHYGERWGRFWLDVARYADTRGYLAGEEDRRYPYAYTYRDWVIRALNDDLPYDQFLVQQIAADLLPANDKRHLAAMGFLTVGRRFLNQQPDIIDDRIDVLARGTMGLTVACARCHDHKFDPVSQKDYYALYGVFASSLEPKELPLLNVPQVPQDAADYQRELKARQEKVDHFLREQGELLAGRLAQTPLGIPLRLPLETVERAIDREARNKLREVRKPIDVLNAGPLAPPRAMVFQDAPTPVTPRVFIRGNPNRPGESVPRRFLTVLSGGNPQPFEKGSGRLELAQAIANPENPLTARVIVNRVWGYHFGTPLVRTPGDFGVKGEAPTHPELLDWLAAQFLEDDWSLKKLHRRMMLSSAYQQASTNRPDARKLDPENRLLSHMNRRRLDFEAMRDSILVAAAQLDPTLGGRPVDIVKEPSVKRRTVYSSIDRQNLPGVFRTFDFASPDTMSPQRYTTTVPQQALFFLNSPFVVEQAQALAAVARKSATISEDDIRALYARVFARKPEPAEIAASLRFLQSDPPRTAGSIKPEQPSFESWAKLAQALLATNEFVFVD